MSLSKILYSFLAIFILSYSSITFAQTSSETTTIELEEIVVTAQRREQNISDVSQAVQALSGNDLDELNITNFDNKYITCAQSCSFLITIFKLFYSIRYR